MRFPTLDEWLTWQETLHPSKIDLGLERVQAVQRRLDLEQAPYAVIAVGGTNGKGSVVALLEAMLRAAGYRVGAYSSPHLLRYNERVRVNGDLVSDEDLCVAFARVDEARHDVSLTYFEFGTLAALDIFARSDLDIVVLEVGMGGRLDAVNIMNPDVAVITTVGIDHAVWLGEDREAIAVEKAGIMRLLRPVVYGDANPPAAVVGQARSLGAPLFCFSWEFGYELERDGWSWWGLGRQHRYLPDPRLRGPHQLKNAATAIMALELLAARFQVGEEALHEGLNSVELPGRLQFLDDRGLRVCDVAHNPQAAAALAEALQAIPCSGETHAVLGMLADKDALGVTQAMRPVVNHWHIAGLEAERGVSAEQLAHDVSSLVGRQAVRDYGTVAEALVGAAAAAEGDDRIVVFGSFYTVAAALAPDNQLWWQTHATNNDPILAG